jgi:hypothetical protein
MAEKERLSTTINKKLKDTYSKIADIEGRNLNYYVEKGLNAIFKEHEKSLKEYIEKNKEKK